MFTSEEEDEDVIDDVDEDETGDEQDREAQDASVEQVKPRIDLETLAQKVFDRLVRELIIENERIGR